MSITNLTFRDLYAYIQEANRDSKGYHYPISTSTDIYPIWLFHICEGRLEFSINRQDAPDMINWAKAGLIFCPDEGKVRLIRINNCIADYDEINYISIDTSLNDDSWFEFLVDRMRRESDYKVIQTIQSILVATVGTWYKQKDESNILVLEPGIREIVSDTLYADGFTSDMVYEIGNVIAPVIANAMLDVISTVTKTMTDLLINHADEFVEIRDRVTTTDPVVD